MTLVLPFNCDQLHSDRKMPCVFDGDAFERDFQSALMSDWSSEIADYGISSEDSSEKTPPDASDLKRKSSETSNESLAKKIRIDVDDTNLLSDAISSSPEESFSEDSPPSSVEEMEEEEEEYIPRRRVPPMWSSRQKWKDERKKVLKMSISKLQEIDDPELCLLRSVLVNNTVKRLQTDIRNERQAKLRHKQQKLDFFNERFTSNDIELAKPKSTKADFYDDTSCDELFGISEDLFRSTLPENRVPTPIPKTEIEADIEAVSISINSSNSSVTNNSSDKSDTFRTVSSSSPTATASVFSVTSPSSNAVFTSPAFPTSVPITTSATISSTARCLPSSNNRGGLCATQFRTNRDPDDMTPRVPILDSVVYQSLLASLQSS